MRAVKATTLWTKGSEHAAAEAALGNGAWGLAISKGFWGDFLHPSLPPSTPFLSSQLLLSSLSPNYPLNSYLCQAPCQTLDTAMVEHTVCSRSELLEQYRSDRVTALLKILPWCSRFLKIWSLAIFQASSPPVFPSRSLQSTFWP